jgi:hypothetical protein
MAISKYLSLKYVNSINCTVTFGEGRNGGLSVGDLLSMHNIYGQIWARHLQRERKNVHENTQESSV